jgi:hypothetical protein
MAWKQAARSTDLLSRDARKNRTRNTGAATSKTEWGPHLLTHGWIARPSLLPRECGLVGRYHFANRPTRAPGVAGRQRS